MDESGLQADERRLNALLRPDGSVVVPPRLVSWVLALLRDDLTKLRRNRDVSPAYDVLSLLDALKSAPTPVAVNGNDVAAIERMKLGDVSGEILSSTRAATLMECSPRTIRWALETGRLRGWKQGRAWFITTQDFDNYRFGRKAA